MKDLTQRLEYIERESHKVAIRKSITIFIVIDIVALIILMILSYFGITISINSASVLVLIALFFNICGICSLYTVYKDNEISKMNVALVDSILSPISYKEVIPKDATPEYYEFLTKELPKIATFYAVLDDQKVEIDVQFINNDTYYCLTYVDKANFLSLYAIK